MRHWELANLYCDSIMEKIKKEDEKKQLVLLHCQFRHSMHCVFLSLSIFHKEAYAAVLRTLEIKQEVCNG